jgi:hypothetical protein
MWIPFWRRFVKTADGIRAQLDAAKALEAGGSNRSEFALPLGGVESHVAARLPSCDVECARSPAEALTIPTESSL